MRKLRATPKPGGAGVVVPNGTLFGDGVCGRIKQELLTKFNLHTIVNAELVRLDWDIGRMVDERQAGEGYGRRVIQRLARDLRNDLPDVKGFSERNIGRMIAFFRAYPQSMEVVPQPVAQPLKSLLWLIPWGHHALLLEKVKDLGQRVWYMEQTLANGWSRNVLTLMIESGAHARQGKAITNFDRLLPSPQSDLAGSPNGAQFHSPGRSPG